jgi:hypothetical protein
MLNSYSQSLQKLSADLALDYTVAHRGGSEQ